MKIDTLLIQSELTHKIRKQVLWPHISNNDYTLAIDKDQNTFHVGAYYNKELVSIGTFTKQNNKLFKHKIQYRLRAMATALNYQKKGVGKYVFLKGLEILKEKGVELLWCDARINAVPFYESLKMNSLDKVYNIINIGPHKTMYLGILENIK